MKKKLIITGTIMATMGGTILVVIRLLRKKKYNS